MGLWGGGGVVWLDATEAPLVPEKCLNPAPLRLQGLRSARADSRVRDLPENRFLQEQVKPTRKTRDPLSNPRGPARPGLGCTGISSRDPTGTEAPLGAFREQQQQPLRGAPLTAPRCQSPCLSLSLQHQAAL